MRGRARFGDFELTILSDGPCLFDGGAMFGVVPKPLWSKRIAAAADNRVVLGLNTLVIPTGSGLLIETGLGNKMPDKIRDIYGAQGVMAHDLDPFRTMTERQRFYSRVIPEQG
jgi:hypothetical protein